MPSAWADATFQTMVTGPAVRKGADSSVIWGYVVPSALTSSSERDDVTVEARGAWAPLAGVRLVPKARPTPRLRRPVTMMVRRVRG
jgi:hypothetical protein